MIELALFTGVILAFVMRSKGPKTLVPIGFWILYAMLEFGIIT